MGINKSDLDNILMLNINPKTRNTEHSLGNFGFKEEISKNWFTKRGADEWNKPSYNTQPVLSLAVSVYP